jgi:hypothetical protein
MQIVNVCFSRVGRNAPLFSLLHVILGATLMMITSRFGSEVCIGISISLSYLSLRSFMPSIRSASIYLLGNGNKPSPSTEPLCYVHDAM